VPVAVRFSIPPQLAIDLAFLHHSVMRRGLYLPILFQSWLDKR
jgi:hypothetical protein